MSNLQSVQTYLNQGGVLDVAEIMKQKESHSQKEYDNIFSNQRFIDVLIDDYKKWGTIIVAYDFDDTIEPSDPSKPCDMVIELLQICSKLGFTMICFTARTLESDIKMVRERCKQLNINCDYINDDCDAIKQSRDFEHATKLTYNVFLDDRAGLKQSYEVLWGFVKWFLSQKVQDIDARKEGY